MSQNDATTRFSNRVADYVKYRPSYPRALLDFMFSDLGLNEKSIIADIGSGTGIFTKLLLDRGAYVYAVEPNTEMRLVAEQSLGQNAKFISVGNSAEQTGLINSSFDMVCAATAFHWFNADLVKAEWRRILRPGGTAFLVWNVRKEKTAFLHDYEKLLHCCGANYSEAKHRNTEEMSGIAKLFSSTAYRYVSFPNEQVFDLTGLKGRLLSSSYAPIESHPDHASMMKDLEIIYERHQVGGTVNFEYDTKAYFGPL